MRKITNGSTAMGLAALLLVMVAAVPAAAKTARFACSDKTDSARGFTVTVEGETATGHTAVPSTPPKGLVVYAHGYGHTTLSWLEHMKEAARHGLVAVGMNYRGLEIIPDDDDEDSLPSSRGWNAMNGAEDLIAAAQMYERSCPTIETITIYGVSMGGNMSGLAVALAGENGLMKASPADDPLFDYWFDIEGSVNLIETYTESRLAGGISETAVKAQEDIEAETGGSFESAPDAFLERTVVARTDDIAAAGLSGVVIVHGLNDGLVPYNQSRELAALLAMRGVPLDLFTVTLRDSDSEKETTLTGYVTDQVDPDHVSPFAGHGSEKSETHIVIQLGFERLWALADDGATPGPYREFLANGDSGVVPPP
ncbi:MAG TPA: prolyl oligopeptidase family serine peptidase [Actinomycetota bacterium]|nr:prolyl oligopeptidase family serine peptidase [Actinomycetota bacterium]